MDYEGGAGQTTAPTTEVLEGLNDLLQLDHDAIGAYEIAIEKLEDRDHANQISGFLRDHQRHIEELNRIILELGGSPSNEPHATGPFKQAMQSLGALAGDKGTLLAWRTNELQVRTKYDNYAAKAVFWPDNVKRVIDRNALDEERHYRWVADVLQAMGVGTGEGMETDLANQTRERTTQMRNRASGLVDSARTQASEVAGSARAKASDRMDSVRMRAADGLDSAADRLERMGAEGANPRVAGAAHRVAGGMDATADFLRAPDTDRVRSDLEAQIRTRPVQTLLATFAVGFVIGRILR